MKNESIEFQFISDEKESAVPVRQYFRIPISDKESVQVLIKEKKHFVSDISQGGISISSDDPSDLESGEILADCELILGKSRLSGLAGRVVRRTSSGSGLLQYGIQWIDLQTEQRQILDEIILKMKTRILENNDRNVNKI
ncbi:MAG: PilZ domain-containing protein [Desulfobacteraceae bacterium]|nr:PilZ domain-containing protein [Desulfobacteraceae bacterium]